VAELVFDEKGKKVVLRETITERRVPDFLAGSYESEHGTTIIVNHFEAIDASTTRWSSWCNFTFTGFMKFMSLFIGNVIRKRTEGDMQRFKLMVESDEANKKS
ncbi:MAG: SRPBCC family protein, partial [Gammaproteobacteria bacterium]|nr:SRPBCC family protein [Gammaproteobacteria bacterium]